MRFRIALSAAALSATLLLASTASWSQISISVNIAPPPLPVYTQPLLPAVGYIWVPGYWAWADGSYYWVPGTWVQPPQPGLLWTPGYWGWDNGAYLWHEGYWAPEVGFYGGINYGFGYNGSGYAGGYWRNGAFFYNRTVNRIPAGVRGGHFYSRQVAHPPASRASFNGGRGGIQARANAAQLNAERARRVQPLAAQRQLQQAASRNPGLRANANHGRPPIAATARPEQFGAQAPAHGNVRIPERAPNARQAPNAHRGVPNARQAPAPTAHPPARGPAPGPAVTQPRANGPHRAVIGPHPAAPIRQPAEHAAPAVTPHPAETAHPPAARPPAPAREGRPAQAGRPGQGGHPQPHEQRPPEHRQQ
jgi:hypothetical protein